jgi:FkbM family methyltransferase
VLTFVDVGAHVGETARVVRSPRYRFERIHCLEPAAACWPALEQLAAADARVRVHRVGLAGQAGRRTLHAPGLAGATLFADKPFRRPVEVQPETVTVVRARTWLARHVDPSETLVLKLNCEGAEVEILDDLLETDWLQQARSVMVDFDARKIPSLAGRVEELRGLLAGLPVVYARDVMVGRTHRERVGRWLESVGLAQRRPLAEARFALRELSQGRRPW